MLRFLLAVTVGFVVLGRTAHSAACNENNHLDDYLYEWLSSGDDALSTARQDFGSWNQADAGYEAFVRDYKTFFGQRTAPIAEIGYCTSVQLSDRVNYALSRFH
jgi:hypothetical protein